MNISALIREKMYSRNISERLVCKDGFEVSVQASAFHYCIPRKDEGPWTDFELGFPSERPTEAIMEHAEDENNPTDTVYSCVPEELVVELLEKHGGFSHYSEADDE